MIQPELCGELEKYIGGIIHNQGGILLEIGGMPEHRHLVAKFKADRSFAEMIRLIKANSSKWANERAGMSEQFRWQEGYTAFTVSASQIEAVRGYVRRQEEHHRKRSFQEEYEALLNRHEIEYDPHSLWG